MPAIVHPSPIPLADFGIDRAGHRRRDDAWLNQARASANAQMMLLRDGMVLVEGSGPAHGGLRVGDASPPGRPLLWLGPQAHALAPNAPLLFLGETENGSPVFAIDMPRGWSVEASPIAGLGVFEDFRAAAMGFSDYDAGLAATARSMFEWHHRHGHCGNCGARTTVEEAGWKRVCPACEAEHFPRTDPVAIMLAVKDDKCLLGRQKAWRPGFWSCLAGFIEPGETIEQGAAREVLEEAGVRTTGKAEYLFCQPWPFPSSLMIGLLLEAETDAITVDPHELEDARWFTREEAAAMMAGTHPDFFAPPRLAVAHHVLKAWVERG